MVFLPFRRVGTHSRDGVLACNSILRMPQTFLFCKLSVKSLRKCPLICINFVCAVSWSWAYKQFGNWWWKQKSKETKPDIREVQAAKITKWIFSFRENFFYQKYTLSSLRVFRYCSPDVYTLFPWVTFASLDQYLLPQEYLQPLWQKSSITRGSCLFWF